MRLKSNQTGYVASKIGIDLANSGFTRMPKGKDAVVKACKDIIDANLAMEKKFPLLAWSYMKSPLRTFIRKGA